MQRRRRAVLWLGGGGETGCLFLMESPGVEVAWEKDVENFDLSKSVNYAAILLDYSDKETARILKCVRNGGQWPPALVRCVEEQLPDAAGLCELGAVTLVPYRSRWGFARQRKVLLTELRRLLEQSRYPFDGFVGRSLAMEPVFELMTRASQSDISVLLSGATGTGKEIVAHGIHRHGLRRDKAFLTINCAAMPEGLLESELFGHRRGAFTGAERQHKGLFLEAEGGTIFLDEVGETSPAFQAKLLRVLQEKEVRPVGSEQIHRIDVRVIAATNRDLEKEVRAGRFREDLYFRLSIFPIEIPPLCRRIGDILPLAEFFLERYAKREGKQECILSKKAEEVLLGYAWPGNVRELENEIQRAVVLAEAGCAIVPSMFSRRVFKNGSHGFDGIENGDTLREATARFQAVLITKALQSVDDSRTKAARKLGITREGLYKKMKCLGID